MTQHFVTKMPVEQKKPLVKFSLGGRYLFQVNLFYFCMLAWVLYWYTPVGDWIDWILPSAGYSVHSLDFYSANGLIGDPENIDL